MQIEKIEYFLETARVGSLNQASKILNISHQALNQSMHSIEKELGVQLFYSNTKGIELTDKGKTVLETFERIWGDWSEMKEKLSAKENLTGICKIGFSPNMDNLFYNELWRQLNKTYSELQIVMERTGNGSAFEEVLSGKIDYAIINPFITDLMEEKNKSDKVVFVPIKPYNIEVLVSKQSPLVDNKSISWDDLKSYPIVFPKVIDPTMRPLRKVAMDLEMDIIEVDSTLSMQKGMVANNQAVMFYIDLADLSATDARHIMRIPFEKRTSGVIGVLFRKERQDNLKSDIIVTQLKNICKNRFEN